MSDVVLPPSSEALFKMIKASPAARSMSDADLQALRYEMATYGPMGVRGWLGDQIRKAAAASMAAVEKGDYVGHPFRGNQHVDGSGASRGGAGGAPSGRGARGSAAPRRGTSTTGRRTASRRSGRDDSGDAEPPRRLRRPPQTDRLRSQWTESALRDYDEKVEGGMSESRHESALRAIESKAERIWNSFNTVSSRRQLASFESKAENARAELKAQADELTAQMKTVPRDSREYEQLSEQREYARSAGKEIAYAVREATRDVGKSRSDVAKGDFVGHPFRGNQYTDASGVGRGGAGASDGGRSRGTSSAGVKTVKELKDEIAEVKAFIDEQEAFAEVERDLGSEEGEEQALRNAAKAKKDLKELEAALNERQRSDDSKSSPKPTSSRKIKVDSENIDSKLKGDDLKEFRAQVDEAADAVKQVRETVRDLKTRAASAGARGVGPLLQQALDEVRNFEGVVSDAQTEPTIRQAIRMSTLGMDAAVAAKESLRQVLDKIGGGVNRADTNAINVLQDAADKNFGVSSSRYNLDEAFDYIDS